MWDVVEFKDNLPGTETVNHCKAARSTAGKKKKRLFHSHPDSHHFQHRKKLLLNRHGFAADTGGHLGHALDRPLQEEEVGRVSLPYGLQGSEELTAQLTILRAQQGGLQQVEGRQVLHCQTWRESQSKHKG